MKLEAEYIVFCGVHFMAEVADILSRPEQIAILPDLAAGCSMADMANLLKVQKCWQELAQVIDVENEVTPVTYINSAADLKAFCGKHDGIVCTSSNARKILEWSFAKRSKVLFFPDQHLGRNTGYRMGIPLEKMVTWDFNKPMGGLRTNPQCQNHTGWNGYCSVHQVFKPEQIDNFLEALIRRYTYFSRCWSTTFAVRASFGLLRESEQSRSDCRSMFRPRPTSFAVIRPVYVIRQTG